MYLAHKTCCKQSHKPKSKAISVTGSGVLYGYEMLRIPHCLENRVADGGKVVIRMGRPPFCSPETLISLYRVLMSVRKTRACVQLIAIFSQVLSITSAVLLALALVSAEPEPQRFRVDSYGPPAEVEAAPYVPSGWRPSGRQFLLPTRQNLYVPPAAYGPPTTTQAPTTTEQATTTTEVPTTTEVRHCQFPRTFSASLAILWPAQRPH
jgi:hypothetical protein